MKYLRVRNFEKFQHYKGGAPRNPVWIKFYTSILDDDDLEKLPEISQCHLFRIWLLAARKNNAIPADGEWIAKKIGAASPVDVNLLVSSGYCEIYDTDDTLLAVDASTLLAPKEKKREEEIREDKNKSALPLVPVELNTPEFTEAWERWQKHRREINHALKPTTADAQLRKLRAMGAVTAIAVINQSIENGWQGLFELKGNARPSKPPITGTADSKPGEYDEHLKL